MIHIILVEPEIPQNTGNIARTCAATQSMLHLVKPLGFSLEDRYLKRAGLDYWPLAHVETHDSFQEVHDQLSPLPFYYASVKGARDYSEISYPPDVALVFGRESKGLPRSMLERVREYSIRIPMIEQARSLNLGNSVAIVTYEVLRQNGFAGMKCKGEMNAETQLPDKEWKDYL